uniref:J domain-containing protein n=1 Tax=Chrysotila carterae TaxID=13221 RepID=A0A7S4C2D9_CHRCT
MKLGAIGFACMPQLLLTILMAQTANCGDHYSTLGVPKGADAMQIRNAYRKLALKYHPDRVAVDRVAAATERFRRVQEAYEVLSDRRRRQQYDLECATSRTYQGTSTRPGGQGWPGGGQGWPGGGQGWPRGDQGWAGDAGNFAFGPAQQLRPALRVVRCTLQDLDEGCTVEIKTADGPLRRFFDAVNDGVAGPLFPSAVRSFVFVFVQVPFKQLIVRLIPWWSSIRHLVFLGLVLYQLPPSPNELFRLKVKPGYRPGTKFAFTRSPRQVTFVLREKRHRRLQRQRNDLVCRMTVSPKQAAIGGNLSVPQLSGDDLRIELEPGEVTDGYEKVVEGHGMTIRGGTGKGNLRIQFRVRRLHFLTDLLHKFM